MFCSMYKGEVISNRGKGSEGGKCKIFIPGVYPSKFKNDPANLPWAEPAVSLWGGNLGTSQTGVCGWPSIGAHVWVFFDQGDHNFPIYFAGVQGENGWSASTQTNTNKEPTQWITQSKRVKVQIDEEDDADRLTIEVTGKVNIKITGDVTMDITGNVSNKVTGDVSVEATGAVDMKANKNINIQSSAQVNIKGTKINLN